MSGVGRTTVCRELSGELDSVIYLVFTCDPKKQADRPHEHSNWMDATDRWTEMDEQVALNQWNRKQGRDPITPIELIDTIDQRQRKRSTGDVD